MKRLLYIFLMIIPLLFIAACDDGEQETNSDNLVVLRGDSFIPATGGSGSLTVEDTGDRLTYECNDPWLEVSSSGNTVTFSAPAYYDFNPRTAQIKLRAGNLTADFNVSQFGATVNVDVREIYYSSARSQETINVRTDGMPVTAWTNASWLTLENEDESTYTLTASRNADDFFRRDTLYFSYVRNGETQYIKVPVLQDGQATIENFVGSWTMSSNNILGNPRNDLNVTISVENNLLKVDGAGPYPFFLNFTRGSLRLYGGVSLGEYQFTTTSGNEYELEIFQALYTEEENTYLAFSLTAYPEYNSTGKIVLRLLDDGSAPGTVVGYRYWGFYTESGDPYGPPSNERQVYRDIVLVRN